MPSQIENKEYGPDSTPQEIEAIRSRIYMHSDKVLYWKEVPCASSWQLKIFEAKIDELINGLDGFSMLVDLTDSRPPNASVRKTLREVFAAINQKGLHL